MSTVNLKNPEVLIKKFGFSQAQMLKVRTTQQRFIYTPGVLKTYNLKDGSMIVTDPDLVVGGVALQSDGIGPLPPGVYELQDGGEMLVEMAGIIKKVANKLTTEEKNAFHRSKRVVALAGRMEELMRKKANGFAIMFKTK